MVAETAFNFEFSNSLADKAFTATYTCTGTIDKAYVYNGATSGLDASSDLTTSTTLCSAPVNVANAATAAQTFEAIMYSTAGATLSIAVAAVQAGFFMQALSFGVAALLLAFY